MSGPFLRGRVFGSGLAFRRNPFAPRGYLSQIIEAWALVIFRAGVWARIASPAYPPGRVSRGRSKTTRKTYRKNGIKGKVKESFAHGRHTADADVETDTDVAKASKVVDAARKSPQDAAR